MAKFIICYLKFFYTATKYSLGIFKFNSFVHPYLSACNKYESVYVVIVFVVVTKIWPCFYESGIDPQSFNASCSRNTWLCQLKVDFESRAQQLWQCPPDCICWAWWWWWWCIQILYSFHRCECDPFHIGDYCKELIDKPCSLGPCENGECSPLGEAPNGYSCSCAESFFGTKCDIGKVPSL